MGLNYSHVLFFFLSVVCMCLISLLDSAFIKNGHTQIKLNDVNNEGEYAKV